MLVTWILAWLHVLSAIGWLGGGIMFGFVIAPALARLSPASSGEFMVKVVPRVARFFQASAGLTIVFGFLLLYNLGGMSLLDLSTSYGVDLTVGMGAALAGFLVSEFVTSPILLKAVRLVRESMASPAHQPSPELPRTMRLVSLTSIVTLILLLVAFTGMVGAGFY